MYLDFNSKIERALIIYNVALKSQEYWELSIGLSRTRNELCA